MENALMIESLTKHYKDFTLDNVSFKVPQGATKRVTKKYRCIKL